MSKLRAGLIAALVVLCGSLMFGNMLLDRLADKVIERMEKPYSPSLYGPGLDPDRLDGHKTSFVEGNWEDQWEASRRDFSE